MHTKQFNGILTNSLSITDRHAIMTSKNDSLKRRKKKIETSGHQYMTQLHFKWTAVNKNCISSLNKQKYLW